MDFCLLRLPAILFAAALLLWLTQSTVSRMTLVIMATPLVVSACAGFAIIGIGLLWEGIAGLATRSHREWIARSLGAALFLFFGCLLLWGAAGGLWAFFTRSWANTG